MQFTTFLSVAFATLAAASPYPRQASTLTDFLLVTTSQYSSTTDSSALADVNATSLYDPLEQEDYLVRTIQPGYLSLPRFNLTDGNLHVDTTDPFGSGDYIYNSTGSMKSGEELEFAPGNEPAGNLGLKDGYLLTVAGQELGWTICDGPLGEPVVYWQGNDTSCTSTYIHAVEDAPY